MGNANWDKYLEQAGLLKYQTKGLSDADVQKLYQQAGLQTDWGSLGRKPQLDAQGNVSAPVRAPQPQRPGDNWNNDPNFSAPAPVKQVIPTNPNQNNVTPPTPQIESADGYSNDPLTRGIQQYTERKMGYTPGYWDNPHTVARWFNQVKGDPATQLPEGMDKQTLDGLYSYMQMRNNNLPPEKWQFLHANDPMREYITSIPDPQALAQQAQAQQQFANDQAAAGDFAAQTFDWNKLSIDQKKAILSNPNFDVSKVVAPGQQGLVLSDPQFDWSKLPLWQRIAYYAMSNPATAPIVQGAGMGAAMGGGVGGAVTGGVMGGVLGAMSNSTNPLVKTLGTSIANAMMWSSQKVEQTAGFFFNGEVPTFQKMLKDPAHAADIAAEFINKTGGPSGMIKGVVAAETNQDFSKLSPEEQKGYAIWQANKSFYETQGANASLLERVTGGALSQQEKDAINAIAPLFKEQGKVWVLGDGQAVSVQPGYTLEDAYNRILNGQSAEEVLMDYQRAYGASGVATDTLNQVIFDPLNAAPHVAGEIRADIGQVKLDMMTKAAEATGAMTEADAAKLAVQQAHVQASRLKPTVTGELLPWSETGKTFKDLIRTNMEQGSTAALVDAMTPRERKLAGLTDSGRLVEMTPKSEQSKPSIQNFWNALQLQPKAQANLARKFAYENLGVLINWADDANVTRDTAQVLKAVANQDMQAVRNAGAQFLDNPEMYTMSTNAVKDFVPKVEGRAAAYDAAARPREAVLFMADGDIEAARNLVKKFTDGDPKPDFEAWKNKAGDAGIKELASRLNVGAEDITPDFLSKAFEAFKDGRVELSPQEYKVNLLGELEAHMNQWGNEYFGVDPKDTTAASVFKLLKNGQSMMLLDYSPSYLLNNMINENVLLMAGGSFNFEGEGALNARIDRFGVKPSDWGEGNTPAGYEAKTKAAPAEGRNWVNKLADASDNFRRKYGLFNNLTGKMNQIHTKRAYISAIEQFYGKMHKAGIGFDRMAPQLEQALRQNGIDPNLVYRKIEGMTNPAEVGNVLQQGVNDHAVENYFDYAASQLQGVDAARAGQLFDELGLTQELRDRLAKTKTPQEKARVFDSIHQKAMDQIDVREAMEIRDRATHFAQKVKAEGWAGVGGVMTDMQGSFEKRWLDHYLSAGELQADLANVQDWKTRNAFYRTWRTQEQAYWRREYGYEASAWMGMLDGLGVGDARKNEYMSTLAQYMDINQRLTKEQIAAYDDHFAKDYPTVDESVNAWKKLEAIYEKKWSRAEKEKAQIWDQLNSQIVFMNMEVFGPEIGANVRRWVDNKTTFHAEMVKTREAFRQSTKEMVGTQKAAAKYEFYQKTYPEMISKFMQMSMGDEGNLYKGATEPTGPTPFDSPNTSTDWAAAGTEPRQPTSGAQAIDAILAKREAERALESANPESANQAPQSATRVADTGDGGMMPPRQAPAPLSAEPTSPQMAGQNAGNLGGGDVNAQLSFAEQEFRRAQAEQQTRINSIWDTAEQFNRVGMPYDRTILQDKFALLGAMSNPEYGGIEDLTGLQDPRLTPELVNDVLTKRTEIKTAQAEQTVGQAIANAQQAASNVRGPKIGDNTSILQAVKEHGGLQSEQALTLWGEKRPKTAPGVFTKKGLNIDDMARELAYDGYPIDVNRPDDMGGVQQATELIQKARAGEKVYPMGHNYDAQINAAEQAFINSLDNTPEFDQALWQQQFDAATQAGDFNRMLELATQAPDDPQLSAMIEQAYTETAAKAEAQFQLERMANQSVQSANAIAETEMRGQAAMTRQALQEKFTSVFGDKGTAFMPVVDAVMNVFAKITGQSPDELTARYYRDVVREAPPQPSPNTTKNTSVFGEGDLQQSRLEPINRTMTAQEVGDYARALVRAGTDELRRAVNGEATTAERIRLLDAAHKLNPQMAEHVARGMTDVLYQTNGPVWTSKLTQTVESLPMDTMTVEQLRGLVNKGGVKADELKWTGFDDFLKEHKGKVTKAEALNFLQENQVNVQEVTKVEQTYSGEGETKFSQYTLPGGENYREVLFTLPNKTVTELPQSAVIEPWKDSAGYPAYRVRSGADVLGVGKTPDAAQQAAIEFLSKYGEKPSQNYQSPHWNEPNVLAHMRLDDRVDAQGKRVLFVEEVQSDWHQQGREKGYKKEITELPPTSEVRPYTSESYTGYAVYDPNYNDHGKLPLGYGNTPEEARSNALSEIRKIETLVNAPPDAPFAKTWPELVMKRVLRMAAEDGYDKVAWTTGEQQAARYDLSKQVSDITYDPRTNKLSASGLNGGKVIDEIVPQEKVADYIGKEATQKLFTTPYDESNPYSVHTLSGTDLKVGGSGMKGFYDQMLPAFMDKYGKKWGAKVGETELKLQPEGMNQWTGHNTQTGEMVVKDNRPTATVHSVDVTQAMKDSVLQGQPLFQDTNKGAVTFDEKGIAATIHAFESADFSTLVHENAHVFRRMLADVATRTNNEQVKTDLATIEQWAGVKNGQWEVAHEEKFARAFEKYIAEGKAPTPKLVAAFETFKNWMLEVYKAITGSQIDVNLTQDVRDVFDRMLGGEQSSVDSGQSTVRFDPNTQYIDTLTGQIKPKEKLTVSIDEAARKSQADEWLKSDFMARLKADAAKLREENAAPQSATRVADTGDGMAPPQPSPNGESANLGRESALFQDGGTMPALPPGGYDQLSQYVPMSKLLQDGWYDKVLPILDKMKEASQRPENRYSFEGLDPSTQGMMNDYLNQVRGQMASTKHAAVRYGETQKNYAMLDYNRQYNIDNVLQKFIPYEFFATRSAMNWIPRMLDHPAWGANLARLYKVHNTYQSQLPERLRNKYFIPMPFLPKWMGGGVYVDPLTQLFPFKQFMQPFEAYASDQSQLANSAMYVLRGWIEDGTMTKEAAQAAMQSQNGPDWEKAVAQVKMDQGESASTGADYFSMLFSPALYATVPYYLATGKTMTNMGWPNGQLPVTRFGSGMETAFKGTSLEWLGNAAGLLAKPEKFARQQMKLNEFGQWGEFYTERQIANIVAEGADPKEAVKEMIEKKGPLYDQAVKRVREELMLRVPGMAPLYGLAHGATLDKVIGSMIPSLFPGGILPPGEMEQHGLKDEYSIAWKKYENGDKQAIGDFFDKHPEYQARLALRRDPQERLTQFLRSNIRDAYDALGPTDRKQAVAFLGPDFQDFLSADPGVEFSTDQLTKWSQMLGGLTATPPNSTGTSTSPLGATPQINYFAPEITAVTDQFFTQRKEKFPHYYQLQSTYYSLPRSEQDAFLMKFPEYKDYMKWKDKWYKDYPELKPVFNGEIFRRIDTSNWSPVVLQYVQVSALTGEKLPSGVSSILKQMWIQQGKPNGNFNTWVEVQVYPSIKNQMMPGMTQ